MTEQAQTQTVTYTEAPASWNTYYVDPAGFKCQLTLRDTSGAALLVKASAALKKLLEQGCEPFGYYSNNPQQTPDSKPESKQAEAPKLDDGSVDPAWCSIHKVAMKRRQNEKGVWYSHKLDDGDYCNGKAK